MEPEPAENGNWAEASRLGFCWPSYPKITLIVVTLICLLPFVDKALHIDDPLFVWAGRQMHSRWWDPYGFQINWYGWQMPMHEVTKNPPLASAFVALVISIFGENELALHLMFFVFAILAILGTYALARRCCDHPFYTAVATLLTPVFIVSSTTVMCDVLMVALWVWAVVLWIRGLDHDKPNMLVLGASLAGACALAKYFGIALVPLLLIYTLVRRNKPSSCLLYLLIPLAMIALYESSMHALYGHGLIWDAFSYADQNKPRGVGTLLRKAFTILGFAGSSCAILLFGSGFWKSKLRACIALAVAIIFLFPTSWYFSDAITGSGGFLPHFGIAVTWTLLTSAGLAGIGLSLFHWYQYRSAESILLLLWVCGTFAFCILNWTISGRSVLPMTPALAILLLRQIDPVSRFDRLRLNWALSVAALISIFVSLADYRLANSARAVTSKIQSKFGTPSNVIWFQGHWGFQYYAQSNGWRAFDSSRPSMSPGDLMILPSNNTNLKPLPGGPGERVAILEEPVLPWIATMSRSVGAGFYMDTLGPLPFSFGAVPAEKYYVIRVN